VMALDPINFAPVLSVLLPFFPPIRAATSCDRAIYISAWSLRVQQGDN
jgi:hypothetical protein